MKAYVFPGQGAQFSGMGKSLYESSPEAKALMDKANDILGFRITDIMFNGTDEDLRATRVTQPAIFIHSVALAMYGRIPGHAPETAANGQAGNALDKDGQDVEMVALPEPDMVGGHSLGEFSALVAAGAVSFEDGLKLVAVRANEMQKCCEKVPGTMAAIIGLPTEKVEEICRKVSANSAELPTEQAQTPEGNSQKIGVVVPANYNCDGQIVISGEKEAVLAACEACKQAAGN